MCPVAASYKAATGFRCSAHPLPAAKITKKPSGVRPLWLLEPPRAERLRRLIEAVVLAGLVAPASSLAQFAGHALPLVHGCRGAAEVAFVRQVAMYLAHVGCGLSYTQAAALFGRDRTTAAHACRLVEERRDDPGFDRILDLLESCIHMGLRQIEPDSIGPTERHDLNASNQQRSCE